MRYGFATSASNTSTNAAASAIVTSPVDDLPGARHARHRRARGRAAAGLWNTGRGSVGSSGSSTATRKENDVHLRTPLIALGLATRAGGRAQRLRRDGVDRACADPDHRPPGPPTASLDRPRAVIAGSVEIIRQRLYNPTLSEAPIGRSTMTCTFADTARADVLATYVLPKGEIVVTGAIQSRLLYEIPIVGGTRLFDNARGSLTVTSNAPAPSARGARLPPGRMTAEVVETSAGARRRRRAAAPRARRGHARRGLRLRGGRRRRDGARAAARPGRPTSSSSTRCSRAGAASTSCARCVRDPQLKTVPVVVLSAWQQPQDIDAALDAAPTGSSASRFASRSSVDRGIAGREIAMSALARRARVGAGRRRRARGRRDVRRCARRDPLAPHERGARLALEGRHGRDAPCREPRRRRRVGGPRLRPLRRLALRRPLQLRARTGARRRSSI